MPVGITWFEVVEGDHFGSALFHAISPEHQCPLVDAFVAANWSKGFVF